MGGRITAHPKACDGQAPGTTALSTDELQWWKRHDSFHSFIHSFLTPLLFLPETLAEVLRLSKKVKNSLFREWCYFRDPCLSTAVTAGYERKTGY